MNHWLDNFLRRTYPRDGGGGGVVKVRLPQPLPPLPPSGEFAWVIECNNAAGTLLYWTGRGVADFSPHHLDAIRFARKSDAVTVRDWVLRNPFLRVVEHGWSH